MPHDALGGAVAGLIDFDVAAYVAVNIAPQDGQLPEVLMVDWGITILTGAVVTKAREST